LQAIGNIRSKLSFLILTIFILQLLRYIFISYFINYKTNKMSETNFATIFTHQQLTALSQQSPTQATLQILHQEINANSIVVPSARGSGLLEHYALVTEAATYTAASGGIAFVPPVHPELAPAVGANAAAITEANRHAENRR
jgi:hypothetical protein